MYFQRDSCTILNLLKLSSRSLICQQLNAVPGKLNRTISNPLKVVVGLAETSRFIVTRVLPEPFLFLIAKFNKLRDESGYVTIYRQKLLKLIGLLSKLTKWTWKSNYRRKRELRFYICNQIFVIRNELLFTM